ncbi:MAG: P-loop NTPase, partial [Firmicutes bacterium]|nr:P-loop NTPase [Bacillota bacterium]
MKALVINSPDAEKMLMKAGVMLTIDPADEVAVCVTDVRSTNYAPPGIPLLVISSGTIADLVIRKNRPDAELISLNSLVAKVRHYLTVRNEVKLIHKDPDGGFLVVIYSNKGGVGKTTIGCGLALALAELGVCTALCDLDLLSPNVADHFNIDTGYGIEMAGNVPLNRILVNAGENLSVLPALGSCSSINDPVIEAGITRAVQDLLHEKQVVIVDTPGQPLEKPWIRPLIGRADMIILVVDQSPYTIKDTRRNLPALLDSSVSPEVIKLVLNNYIPKAMSRHEVEKAISAGVKGLRLKVSATIPHSWHDHVAGVRKGVIPGSEALKQLGREVVVLSGTPVESVSDVKTVAEKRRSFLDLFNFRRKRESFNFQVPGLNPP